MKRFVAFAGADLSQEDHYSFPVNAQALLDTFTKIVSSNGSKRPARNRVNFAAKHLLLKNVRFGWLFVGCLLQYSSCDRH
jgi:hypothetical protein